MRNILNITMTAIVASVLAFGGFAMPVSAAADRPSPTSPHGPWFVTNLASESEGYVIEAYKVDKSLVAWTELDQKLSQRKLYAYDGQAVRLLATMPASEWNDPSAYFYDTVKGSFDVADGLIAWIQNDGNDREVYAYDGEKTFQVSDNGFADKHPIVSRGRIAWTSDPGNITNLMVREPNGRIQKVAQYHVPNYAFSGKNLFWIEKVPNRSAFQVAVHDGSARRTVGGNADDKPMADYFIADGEGSVAWETYPKWSSEEHQYWHSLNGDRAVMMGKRLVNLVSPRLEDTKGPEILLNSKDIIYSWNQRHLGNSLLKITYNLQEQTEFHRRELTKARYMDGGYVTHLVAENASPLVMHNGTEHYLSLDIVVKDLFDADGPTAAGAIQKQGVVLYANEKATVVPTVRQVRSIAVKGGDVAWIDGETGKGILSFATPSVTVKTANGVVSVAGRLVKAPGSKAVYLSGKDGVRYAFPGEGQFYSWYDGFESVQTLSRRTIDAMPVGGTVLYRTGSRLVKARTANTVYAVGKAGTLYPIANTYAAREIGGVHWVERIDVMSDARLADYQIGKPVDGILAYNAAMAGLR